MPSCETCEPTCEPAWQNTILVPRALRFLLTGRLQIKPSGSGDENRQNTCTENTSSIKINSNIVYQAKLVATILLWCSSVRVNFGGFTPEPGGGGSQEKNEVKVVPEKLCWETSCQKNRDK